MADETQTPDMQGAGAPAPAETMSQSALMGALQHRGGMGNIGGIMQALQPQASPGLGFGSGVLSAIGGRPGQNPYLQSLMQQQQVNTQTFSAVDQMQHRMQQELARQQEIKERQQMHQLQRDDIARTVRKDLLFGKDALQNEDQRMVVAQQHAQDLSKIIGTPLPQASILSMAKGGPNQSNQKELAIKLQAADSAEDPAERQSLTVAAQQFFAQHGGKPQDWATTSTTLRSRPYLESVGLPTPEKLRQQATEAKLKDIQLFEHEHPEARANPQVYADATMLHRQMNKGQDYREGTDATRATAYQLAELKRVSQEAQKTQLLEESKLRLQAALAATQDARQQATFAQQLKLLEMRLDAQREKDLAKGKTAAEQKRDQALAVTETFIAQFEEMIPEIEKGGFTPTGSGLVERERAKAKRGTGIPIPGYSEPNADAWRRWLELQGNMIGFARSVQNEIGPRAMAAFNQAARISEDPPSAQALRDIAKQMRAQVEASRTEMAQPPVPAGGATVPTSPLTRSVRARNAEGKTATIKLAPGEAMPAGWTEIK